MARLLIIDDDVCLLALLHMHLKGAGHTVRAVPDAAEGIRQMLADAPDLVLSDVAMPYLDGLELLHAMRSDPATRHIPVIFLTGKTDDDTRARANRLGIDDFLTKPITIEHLLSSINMALTKLRSCAVAESRH